MSVGAGDWEGEGEVGAGDGVLGSVSISSAGDPQSPVSLLVFSVMRVMGTLSSRMLISSVLPSS